MAVRAFIDNLLPQQDLQIIGLAAIGSEIPSFYIILHLALVWHDLLDPIIFFRQRGFHRAVTALAAAGFVVFRIEDG